MILLYFLYILCVGLVDLQSLTAKGFRVRKIRKRDFYVYLALMTTFGVFLLGPWIQIWWDGWKGFRLSSVDLKTVYEANAYIPEGAKGYVVFYTDLLECRNCLRSMAGLDEIAQTYADVAFYAVLRGEGSPHIFERQLIEFDFPGEYLVDEQSKIHEWLGLGSHPMLLFFDSDQKLFTILPMNVEHKALRRQIHRYISVM